MRTPSRAALAVAMGVFTAGGITVATTASAGPAHPSASHRAAAPHASHLNLALPGTGVRLTASVDPEGDLADDVEVEDQANDQNEDQNEDADEAGEDQNEDQDGADEVENENEDADEAENEVEDNSGPSANSGPGSVDSGHHGSDD